MSSNKEEEDAPREGDKPEGAFVVAPPQQPLPTGGRVVTLFPPKKKGREEVPTRRVELIPEYRKSAPPKPPPAPEPPLTDERTPLEWRRTPHNGETSPPPPPPVGTYGLDERPSYPGRKLLDGPSRPSLGKVNLSSVAEAIRTTESGPPASPAITVPPPSTTYEDLTLEEEGGEENAERVSAEEFFAVPPSPPPSASPFVPKGTGRIRETIGAAEPRTDSERAGVNASLQTLGSVGPITPTLLPGVPAAIPADIAVVAPTATDTTAESLNKTLEATTDRLAAQDAEIDDPTGKHAALLPTDPTAPPEPFALESARPTDPDGSPRTNKGLSPHETALESSLLEDWTRLDPPPAAGPTTALISIPPFNKNDDDTVIVPNAPPKRSWWRENLIGLFILFITAAVGTIFGMGRAMMRHRQNETHNTQSRHSLSTPTVHALSGRCVTYAALEQSGQTALESGYTQVCPNMADQVTASTPICRPVGTVETLTLCNALVRACGRSNNGQITYDETCLAAPPAPFPSAH